MGESTLTRTRPKQRAWDAYEAYATRFVQSYESLSFAEVHASILDLLPKRRSLVLDVGAGSGRDASGLAELGHVVYAAEPSAALRSLAEKIHPQTSIVWMDDALPSLERVRRLRIRFDFILLSAVWMHVPPRQRPHALRSLVHLLKPSGMLAISLRLGPADRRRRIHRVSEDELVGMGIQCGLSVTRIVADKDKLGRAGVGWSTVVLQRNSRRYRAGR
jgi:SAM-dependent methyltransferase